MFSCKECQHIESSEDMLKVHYDFVHIRKGSNGGHRFLNTSDPTHQQRAVHKGVKHPCGHCGQKYTSKRTLAEHQKAVHEGVRNPCEQCGHQFSSKGNLSKHKKAIRPSVYFKETSC